MRPNRLGISAVALCRSASGPMRLLSLSAPYDGRAVAIGAGSQMGVGSPLPFPTTPGNVTRPSFLWKRVSPVALRHWPRASRHSFRAWSHGWWFEKGASARPSSTLKILAWPNHGVIAPPWMRRIGRALTSNRRPDHLVSTGVRFSASLFICGVSRRSLCFVVDCPCAFPCFLGLSP
jgi:hypothetical protein